MKQRRVSGSSAVTRPSWTAFLLAVSAVLGSFTGGLAGLLLLAVRRVTRRSAIAFGPAILAGAIAAILWGRQIADWYTETRCRW